MPRYYFDIRQDSELSLDSEGEELTDIDAAEREAALAAVQIAPEYLDASRTSLGVEVRDQDGRKVVQVTVTLTVERC